MNLKPFRHLGAGSRSEQQRQSAPASGKMHAGIRHDQCRTQKNPGRDHRFPALPPPQPQPLGIHSDSNPLITRQLPMSCFDVMPMRRSNHHQTGTEIQLADG